MKCLFFRVFYCTKGDDGESGGFSDGRYGFKERMNILIGLYKYTPYGGLQKDTQRVIQEAVRRGHQVTVLTTRWDEDRTDGVTYEMVPVHGWTNTARMAAFGETFRRRAASWDGVSLAMNRLPGADFYFAADSCNATVLPRRPLYWLKRFLPRYRAIVRQEAAVFDAKSRTTFLLISEMQRVDFMAAYPEIAAERYVLLVPGIDSRCRGYRVDDALRESLRAECGAGPDDVLLVTVGSNLHLKGVDRVLQCLKKLPDHVRYVVIGNNRAVDGAAMCRQFGVPQERVYFAEPKKNVPDYLCSADLMVHLAREEGAGAVLLEGVSCGLPVVCTAACGFAPFLREISEDCVVPEPFQETTAFELVNKALAQLETLKRLTADYAATHDFTRRSAEIVDRLEQKAAES